MQTLVDDLRDRPPDTLIPQAASEAGRDAAAEDKADVEATDAVPLSAPKAKDLAIRVLIVPVKTGLDEVAGAMLSHLLALGDVGSEVLSSKTLATEALSAVERLGVDAVCLSALRPFPVMQARYLAKRLRTRFPDLKILIGLWDSQRPSVGAHRNLENVHADWVVTTLANAIAQVCPTVHCKGSPALETSKDAAVAKAKETPPVVDKAP